MKTIIEITGGQLYIYEQSEKKFHVSGNHLKKQTSSSIDLGNDCYIPCGEDDNFFLVIDGPVYSPKKKSKKKPAKKNRPKKVQTQLYTTDMKEGDRAKITGVGSLKSNLIGVYCYKRNGFIIAEDDNFLLCEKYPISLVSPK